MAEENTRRKSKIRGESEEDTPKTSTSLVSPTLTQQVPAIAPESRDELVVLMQELLLKTQDLTFEYSTLECDDMVNCPLCKKSKELFKVVKKLIELFRKMAPQPPVSYVG